MRAECARGSKDHASFKWDDDVAKARESRKLRRKTRAANCVNAEDDLSNGWRSCTGRILEAHASISSHDKL